MKKDKINKQNIKKMIIYFLIISTIVVGGILIKLGCYLENSKESIYQYIVEKQDNYEVLLKPNTFYDSQTLPSGLCYASNAIEAFTIDFQYHMEAEQKADVQYHYSVVGNLIGKVIEVDEEKEVWNKSFLFLENNAQEKESIEEFSVQCPINIKYEDYLNLVNAYEKEYKIKIEPVLKIRFVISYDISFNTIEDEIELEIPITDTITEVKTNNEKIASKEITNETENTKIESIVCYILGSVLIIGASIAFITRIYKNAKIDDQPINRILKNYGDLIVTVTNKPDISNLKIMKLNTLEDLIDVAEQNQTHIIHYENNFYVMIHEYAYWYVLIPNHE